MRNILSRLSTIDRLEPKILRRWLTNCYMMMKINKKSGLQWWQADLWMIKIKDITIIHNDWLIDWWL